MKNQTVQIIIKTSCNQSYSKVPRQAEILFNGSIKNNFEYDFRKTVTNIGSQFYMNFCGFFFSMKLEKIVLTANRVIKSLKLNTAGK